MRAEQADVVIIGAGLAGSAAARALASRGRSVVLLEAFQPGHRRGSSHGSARIFRRAYPDPLYVRLTGQAQVLWRQLADEAGEELVTTTGAIDYGPARTQEKMYEILTGFGVPAELIEKEGAVSKAVAIAMAEGALARSRANITLAITGFADKGEEPGLVHFACARAGRITDHREAHFGAIGRGAVRVAALEVAIEMMTEML